MAGKKRKRWNRAAKASQFAPGAGGEMVYTGRYCTFCGGEEDYRRSKRARYALSALMGVAALAGGMIPVPAMVNTWYVILPYMFTVLSVVSVIWAVCRMGYWGNPLREYVYDATVRQLPKRTILAMILSMCTLCGQICYMVLHGLQDGGLSCNLAFLALQVVVFVGSTLMRRAEIRWKWSV